MTKRTKKTAETHQGAPPQAPHLIVRCYYETGRNVPDQGGSYLHCAQCLDEMATVRGQSAKSYARQQVAITTDGHLQVWCTRHDVNIALIRMRAEYREVPV